MYMKISRVLNNNAVMTQDKGKTLLLMGLSIGYKKRVGDSINQSQVEKIFVLTNPNSENRLQEMISFIPDVYFKFAIDAVSKIKTDLQKEYSDNLYIMLTDHIYSSVQRYREGIVIENALLMETEKFYNQEYKVAKEIVKMANETFHVNMQEDEVGFITFHIINSQIGNSDSSVMKMTRLIKDILMLVKERYHIQYKEDSLAYSRFITHLKYFSRKVFTKTAESSYDDDLLEMMKTRYPKEYEGAVAILKWIEEKYKYHGTDMDALYLTIHIARIIKD